MEERIYKKKDDDWAIVNRATGEMLDVPDNKTLVIECIEDLQTSIDKPPDTEKPKKTRRMKFKFAMANVDAIQRDTSRRLPSGDKNDNYLSLNERGMLYTLEGYINYNCIIEKSGKTMKLSDIQALMEWSRPVNTKTLSMLQQKDYLIRIPDGKSFYVMMNPDYVYRGYSQHHKELIEQYSAVKERRIQQNVAKSLDT